MFGRPTGVQRGGDVSVAVSIPLEDMYRGGNVRVNVTRRVVCRGCSNQAQRRGGAAAIARCNECGPTCPHVTKIVHQRMGMMLMQREVQEPSPERCKEDTKVLVGTVERGMADDAELVFQRASEQTPGRIPGNVVVKLKSARHAVFHRVETDLFMTISIPLRQALLGFERTIRHLDGHTVVISNDGITTHGQVLKLAGEGMPVHGVPSEFGSLHVTVTVEMPKVLTPEERAFVTDHFAPSETRPLGL
jgi:DnaJ-class molecular chaperone